MTSSSSPRHGNDPCVSVVIPVYNSGEFLGALYERLTKVLQAAASTYQIVLVDDCSPDDTWSKVSELASQDPRITALHLRKNAGYDNAVMAGLRFAQHPLIVIMDDDAQHAPEDIPDLIKGIESGYDAVYAAFGKKHQSGFKNAGSWLNGRIAEIIIQKPRGLYLSPFKILRRDVAQEVVKYSGPYPYVDALIFRVTASIDQIEVPHHDRVTGTGAHGLIRSLRIMLNFVTTSSILPLRVAILGGLAISLVSAVSAIALVLANLLFGYGLDAPGWTSIILITMLLGGGQLMAIGIVGEYVGRTFLNLSGRPQYVVGEVLGASPTPGDESSISATHPMPY